MQQIINSKTARVQASLYASQRPRYLFMPDGKIIQTFEFPEKMQQGIYMYTPNVVRQWRKSVLRRWYYEDIRTDWAMCSPEEVPPEIRARALLITD